MNDENNSNRTHDLAADSYVDEQLERTRKTFNTTRIVSGVLIAFVALYMGCITSKLKTELEPKNLSDHIVTFAENQFNDHSADLKQKGLDWIPEIISERIPNLLLDQIPKLTQSLQEKEGNFTSQFVESSRPVIAKTIDTFLVNNEDKVKEYFTKIKQAKEADSPQERERLQSEAEQTMTDIADEFWGGMESIAKSEQFQQNLKSAQFQGSLSQVQNIEEDLRPFTQQDEQLSPEDLDIRFGIAMILEKLKWSTDAHPRQEEPEEQ